MSALPLLPLLLLSVLLPLLPSALSQDNPVSVTCYLSIADRAGLCLTVTQVIYQYSSPPPTYTVVQTSNGQLYHYPYPNSYGNPGVFSGPPVTLTGFNVTYVPSTGQTIPGYPVVSNATFQEEIDITFNTCYIDFIPSTGLYMVRGQANDPAVVNLTCPSGSSSSSSSTGSGSVMSDPRFVGFWGQSFYVGGRDGGVYNVISDASLQVNGLFFYLTSIHCPLVDGLPMVGCMDHPGQYFGVLAIVTQGGDHLRVTAGHVDEGFHRVELNGAVLDPLLPPPYTPSLSLSFHSNRSLTVTASLYRFTVLNVDLYVDLAKVEVTCWDCLVQEVRPEGLLGRTWDASKGQLESEEDAELYREQDGDILGCKFARDRFCHTEEGEVRQRKRDE